MNTFDKMVDSFTEFADLRAFSESQNKIILNLQNRIKQLEEEREGLLSQINSKSPQVDVSIKNLVLNENNNIELIGAGLSPGRILCEIEIERLREVVMAGPLTFEETKKLDILVKNLIILKEEEKKVKKNDIKSMPTEELLRLAGSL
jgi:hypothetical protein